MLPRDFMPLAELMETLGEAMVPDWDGTENTARELPLPPDEAKKHPEIACDIWAGWQGSLDTKTSGRGIDITELYAHDWEEEHQVTDLWSDRELAAKASLIDEERREREADIARRKRVYEYGREQFRQAQKERPSLRGLPDPTGEDYEAEYRARERWIRTWDELRQLAGGGKLQGFSFNRHTGERKPYSKEVWLAQGTGIDFDPVIKATADRLPILFRRNEVAGIVQKLQVEGQAKPKINTDHQSTANRDREIQKAADKLWEKNPNYLKDDVADAIAKTEKFRDHKDKKRLPLSAARICTLIRMPKKPRRRGARNAT